MDIKAVKEFLKSDEGKALIEAEKEGLVKKTEELLGKIKKKEKENEDFQARLAALEAEKEEAETKAAEKSGDVEKIKAQLLDKHKKEKEALENERNDWKNKYSTGIVDRDLADALNSVGAISTEDARILIKAKHKVEMGDGGATIDGKPLKEFVSTWAQSEQGKHYVTAEHNSGGSSNGANGKSKADPVKTMSRSDFNSLSHAERAAHAKAGGTVTD